MYMPYTYMLCHYYISLFLNLWLFHTETNNMLQYQFEDNSFSLSI